MTVPHTLAPGEGIFIILQFAAKPLPSYSVIALTFVSTPKTDSSCQTLGKTKTLENPVFRAQNHMSHETPEHQWPPMPFPFSSNRNESEIHPLKAVDWGARVRNLQLTNEVGNVIRVEVLICMCVFPGTPGSEILKGPHPWLGAAVT